MPSVRSSDAVILPPYAEPRHYELSLTPDMRSFTFDGVVDIVVDILSATSSLVLHSKELTYYDSTTFTATDGSVTKATSHTTDYGRTTVTFAFGADLAAGEGGTLHIEFKGILNNDMCGFYRSTYKTVAGEERFMLSTQFEALDARRCFPCWDEPARKATFGTRLIVDVNLTAFSNMPVTELTLLAGGKKSLTFAPTPKMSSYLLAFVIGEFDYLQAHTKDGVAVRVYTPPGQTEQGRFGLDVAVKSIEFYDECVARSPLCLAHASATTHSPYRTATFVNARQRASTRSRALRPGTLLERTPRCLVNDATTRPGTLGSATLCRSSTWLRFRSSLRARWRTGGS